MMLFVNLRIPLVLFQFLNQVMRHYVSSQAARQMKERIPWLPRRQGNSRSGALRLSHKTRQHSTVDDCGRILALASTHPWRRTSIATNVRSKKEDEMC